MKKKNSLARVTTLDIVILVFLLLLSLIAIFPFYQVVILSFSTALSYAQHPMYLLPYAFDTSGYRAIISDSGFVSSVLVTLFVTIVGTTINMYLSVTGAYVLSRKHLIGRNFLMNLILITMFFGGGLIPSYLVGRGLGLVNSIWALILPNAISTYYMIIMKNYFLSLPQSLIEAAQMDGASEMKILAGIVIPISVPFMATFTLFYAVARWNEWYLSNLYINKSNLYPLQIYLRNVLISMSNTLVDAAKKYATEGVPNSVAARMAVVVVTSVPILCVYPFIQKHFVKGILIGGVKE